MLTKLVDLLKEELKKPLPGKPAHSIMLPIVRAEHYLNEIIEREPKPSGVLILFYQGKDHQIKFPLMQRPQYNGVHSGQVSLPGGKWESSDRDIIETALRESEEELGIDPLTVKVLGQLSDVYVKVSNFNVKPVLAYTEQIPEYHPDELEVEKLIEADLTDIMRPEKRKRGDLLVAGKYRVDTPYFEIDERIVWGATAMILSELSELIRNTGLY